MNVTAQKKHFVKMALHSWGGPRTGPDNTGPTSRMANQFRTHLPTVKCAKMNHCECQEARKLCNGSHPSSIFCNKIRQTALTQGKPHAGNARRFTKNAKITSTRSTATHRNYCQVVYPFGFHQDDTTFALPHRCY